MGSWLKRMSEVVSVRIKKETKDTLERNGVDIALAVRSHLEKLAWKTQRKKNVRNLHRLIEGEVKPSPAGFASASVREDRDLAH